MVDAVSDRVETTLEELVGWAEQAERSGRRLEGDADEARLLLGLLRDHLGLGLAELADGDLTELLLEVYPRKVTVLEADDAGGVIPTVRDMLAFCRDTRKLSEAKIARLETELDELEPRFGDAVMDPANWGMARSLVQSMAADGVDFSDQGAVERWISDHNGALPDFGGLGAADADPYEETVDLAEAFGLPDRLPPLRLPEDDELAEAARTAVLLNRARRLADWVGDKREIADGYDLAPSDAAEAADVLGVSTDELADVWHFADRAEFLTFHDTFVTPGPTAGTWPSSDDDETLDTWQLAFSESVSCGHLGGVDPDEQAAGSLDFVGAGIAIVTTLFLSRTDGIPVAELREVIREAATAGLSPSLAEESRPARTEELGDPAGVLLRRLRDLGAVEVFEPAEDEAAGGTAGSGEEVMRLTPLATWAVRIQLAEAGVDVPLLPPVQRMEGADVFALAVGGAEQEIDTELTAWCELHGAETAADELLQAAATGSAAERLFATGLAARLGPATEPRWRRALDDPRLRAHAKMALAHLARAEPPDVPAGLEPTPEDLAWLLTDALAATCHDLEPGEIADQLSESLPPQEQPHTLIELMWRLPHPDVVDVLTVVGDYHPDKKVAKLARKAVFKARSRSSAKR